MRLRPATESDHPELHRIRAAGIGAYRSFAPEGWEPPDEAVHADSVRGRMLDPDHWVTLAEDDDGTVLGYVAAGPAMTGWHVGERIPGTAYLWMLFIDMDQHSRGIGRQLQDSAFEQMRTRGYTRALLRMAAGAEQARGLYETTGWIVIDEHDDETLGMPVLVAELDL